MTLHDTIRKAVSAGPSMADLMRFGVRFAPEDGAGGGSPGPSGDLEDEDGANDEFSDEDGDDAFLQNLMDEDGDEPADPEEDGEEGDDEPDEGAEPAAKPTQAATAGDDAEVEVKVGDETHKVKVGELKRLFGQEAALTRRSQEVAQARETAVAEGERAKTVLTTALERAKEKAKPYTELNFLVLSKRLDEDSLVQLQTDAKAAFDEVKFLEDELGRTVATTAGIAAQVNAETARQAIETLTAEFPKVFGEEWSPAIYNDMLAFADKHGMKNVRGVTDPGAIKLLRMAMLYEKGKTVAKEQVKKVAQQPRKPLRSGTADGATGRDASGRFDGAQARLQRTGSVEDAEAAFMARMTRR